MGYLKDDAGASGRQSVSPVPLRPEHIDCRRCNNKGVLPVSYAHPKTGEPMRCVACCDCEWGTWRFDLAERQNLRPVFYDSLPDDVILVGGKDLRKINKFAVEKFFQLREAWEKRLRAESKQKETEDLDEDNLPI